MGRKQEQEDTMVDKLEYKRKTTYSSNETTSSMSSEPYFLIEFMAAGSACRTGRKSHLSILQRQGQQRFKDPCCTGNSKFQPMLLTARMPDLKSQTLKVMCCRWTFSICGDTP